MKLFKIIINLMINKAPLRQYQLNIGTYLLKKGTAVEVGSIVKEKRLYDNTFRVTVVTGLFFDFQQNKVIHTASKRIIKTDEKKR